MVDLVTELSIQGNDLSNLSMQDIMNMSESQIKSVKTQLRDFKYAQMVKVDVQKRAMVSQTIDVIEGLFNIVTDPDKLEEVKKNTKTPDDFKKISDALLTQFKILTNLTRNDVDGNGNYTQNNIALRISNDSGVTDVWIGGNQGDL